MRPFSVGAGRERETPRRNIFKREYVSPLARNREPKKAGIGDSFLSKLHSFPRISSVIIVALETCSRKRTRGFLQGEDKSYDLLGVQS